jgi:hypothetical protein
MITTGSFPRGFKPSLLYLVSAREIERQEQPTKALASIGEMVLRKASLV